MSHKDTTGHESFPRNVRPKVVAGTVGAGVGGLIIAVLEAIGSSGVLAVLPAPIAALARIGLPMVLALVTAYWKKG
jgi:hypothetical protein